MDMRDGCSYTPRAAVADGWRVADGEVGMINDGDSEHYRARAGRHVVVAAGLSDASGRRSPGDVDAASAPIAVGDPRWYATFPHRVEPLAGEWLPGLLLRCDAANDWSPGTTGRAVLVARRTEYLIRRPDTFTTGAALDLAALAGLLGQPLAAVEATTFVPALRLLCPAAPLGGDDTPLAAVRGWRICPACVRARGNLGRHLALPLVDYCPEHGTPYVSRCACGRDLTPFAPGSRPFVCVGCDRPWSALPDAPTDARAARRSDIARRLYDLLLDGCDGSLLALAERTARAITGDGLRDGPAILGLPRVGLPSRRESVRPLHELVACLAFFAVPAALLAATPRVAALAVVGRAGPACAVCGASWAEHGHVTSIGPGREEAWCGECGARYINGRLYLSYALGVAPAHRLPAFAIADARASLALMGDHLEELCRQDLARSRRSYPYLRARAAQALPDAPHLWHRRSPLLEVIDHYAVLMLAVPQRVWRRKGVSQGDWAGRAVDGWRLGDEAWARLCEWVPGIGTWAVVDDHDSRDLCDAVRFIVSRGPRRQPLPDDVPPVAAVHYTLKDWEQRLTSPQWSALGAVWADLIPGADR